MTTIACMLLTNATPAIFLHKTLSPELHQDAGQPYSAIIVIFLASNVHNELILLAKMQLQKWIPDKEDEVLSLA